MTVRVSDTLLTHVHTSSSCHRRMRGVAPWAQRGRSP